jgi:hypothetical protein
MLGHHSHHRSHRLDQNICLRQQRRRDPRITAGSQLSAALEHLILHEVPTTFLLDDATFQLDRCFEILETYKKEGIPAAMSLFATQLVGMGSPRDFKPDIANLHTWFQNEFLVMTITCLDLRKVVHGCNLICL